VTSNVGLNSLTALKKQLDGLRETQKFPTTEDLNGAAIALTRLQDTYLLDTADMARGDLNGHSSSAKLTGETI